MEHHPSTDTYVPGWRQLPSKTTRPVAPLSPKPAPTLPRDLLVPIAHALLDIEAQKTTLSLCLLEKTSFTVIVPILYDCVKLTSHQALFTFLRSRLNGVITYTEVKKRGLDGPSRNESKDVRTTEGSTQGPGDARFRFHLYTSSTKHLELIVNNVQSAKNLEIITKLETRAQKQLKKRDFLSLQTMEITTYHPVTSYRVKNELTVGLIHTTILLFQAKRLRWRHIPPPADPCDPTEGARTPPNPFTPGPRDKIMMSLGKWDLEQYLESWETPQWPFSLPLRKYRGLINTEHFRRFYDGFTHGWWSSELDSLMERMRMDPEDVEEIVEELEEVGEKDLLGIEGPGPAWLFYNASDSSMESSIKFIWEHDVMLALESGDMDSDDDSDGLLDRPSMVGHFHWIDDTSIGTGTGVEWGEWLKRGIWSEKDAKPKAVEQKVGQTIGSTVHGAEDVD